MKTLRNVVLVMLAAVAIFALSAQLVRAQSIEIRQLLSERGWHGVGGDVQVNQPTLDTALPWVGVWQRSARNGRWGDWMYIKVLINCEQWQQIAFATLDRDYNMVLIADATGTDPVATRPEPGTEPHRTMTAICALYGYQRGRPAPPATGSLQRVDKP